MSRVNQMGGVSRAEEVVERLDKLSKSLEEVMGCSLLEKQGRSGWTGGFRP